MPLDHPLGCEEGLDLFAQDRNAVRLLFESQKRRNHVVREIGMSAAVQLNGPLVASFTEACDVAI